MNSKVSCLTKAFVDRYKIFHSLKKSKQKRLAKDLVVTQALENEETTTGTLLDLIFCGDKTMFEEFRNCTKDIIGEQAVTKEKRNNEWEY